MPCPKIRLRDISYHDMLFLYHLNTNPKIRQVSHNKKKFTLSDHYNWWADKLRKKTFKANVIMLRYKVIGCIRRDRGFISIAIDPEYQGKGIGTEALKKFCRSGDKAEIFLNNQNSEKAFVKANFSPRYTTYVR